MNDPVSFDKSVIPATAGGKNREIDPFVAEKDGFLTILALPLRARMERI
jgi:hypothetical protein